MIADESFGPCGVGDEIAERLAESGIDNLDAPIRRLNGLHTPTPYGPTLDSAVVPNLEAVTKAIRDLANEK